MNVRERESKRGSDDRREKGEEEETDERIFKVMKGRKEGRRKTGWWEKGMKIKKILRKEGWSGERAEMEYETEGEEREGRRERRMVV